MRVFFFKTVENLKQKRKSTASCIFAENIIEIQKQVCKLKNAVANISETSSLA